MPPLPDTSNYRSIADNQCATQPPPTVPATPGPIDPQEPGTRFARALPYELHVNGHEDDRQNQFVIEFANTGRQGAHFYVYSTNRTDGPWRYTVEAGKSLRETFDLATTGGTYAFSVYGPNGFVRTFTGSAASQQGKHARKTAHPEVKAGQYVMIAVTDSGSGMPADIVAKAFEPFFTTKPASKGTGLGLSQVFGFVKQSGGHVKIYSEPGEGTTIKIYLPRFTGPEEAATPARASAKSEVPATETVLLVEDDPRVRASTAATLLELGYTVIEAAGGEEALRKLGENAAIALMLTDIVMPGMNGRQLAEQARKHSRSLKVVFMTGFTRNAVVHNGVLDHDVHFIAKPFTLEQLAAKLRDALAD